MLAAVRRVGRPVIVVLDDLHHVRSGPALELVVGLAEQLPPGSRMVALADERPRWRVSWLMAQGRYRELGVDDLAFDRDEADALAREIGLRLPTEAVEDLVRRTEGWPLGLQLAARMAEAATIPSAPYGACPAIRRCSRSTSAMRCCVVDLRRWFGS